MAPVSEILKGLLALALIMVVATLIANWVVRDWPEDDGI